jgi:4-amino-4-deoxy-L-arabinose transferase-like glycosyltransferase
VLTRVGLAPVLVGAWCAFLFVYGVNTGPLYRTESLRAIIGRECLRGHWLYPILYGEPFLTKPPGHYVAIGLCSLPFGEVSAATARLPSVFAAALAVGLMAALFRRALGETAAILMAVLLPCSLLWLDKVPSAEIDMTLVGWVTAAIVLMYRALESDRRASLGYWVGALLCVAGGTLTKWTAPAFFYLTLLPLLAWRGQLGLLFGWRHLLAVCVAGLVCAVWAVAVVQQVGWESLSETIRKEAAYRFAPKVSKSNPWSDGAIYPLAVFAAHLPVSAFALLTFRRSAWARLDDRGKLLLQLLHCWTWPNLLFWTLVPNHNVRYALPMSAGLMGLGVMGLWGLMDREKSNALPSVRRAGWLLAFVVCWCAAKVVFVEVAVPKRTANRGAESTAAELREHVPAGQPLYVFKLKDEGVTFYFGRPVIKLHDPHALPKGACAVLIRQEWEARAAFPPLELVSCMHDQQGDPIYLVRHP